MSRYWSTYVLLVLYIVITQELSSAYAETSFHSLTYYVKPNTSIDCATSQTCVTLSNFVQNIVHSNASTNITLILLPGDHILDQHTRMNVSHLSQFHIIGYRAHRSLSTAVIRILCDKAGTMTFSHIGELKVEAIALSACGDPTHKYSILIDDVAFVSMTNCTFEDNFSPVKVLFSNLSLEDCTFANNIGVSEGGGIYCNYCNAHFIGYNLFYNNTATSGGGLFAKHSFIIFVGQVHFIKNKARQWGGGIIITEASTLNIKNNTLFYSNSAQTGGGVYVRKESQVLSLGVNVELTGNTASKRGGGIYSNKSNIHFSSSCTARLDHSEQLSDSVGYSSSSTHGCITLRNNTATSGGGFAISASVVKFDCDSLFIQNSANFTGGAMYTLASSSVTFNSSNSTFIENSSQYLGGALYASLLSTITLGCKNSAFIANSALYGGGALAVHKGSIDVKGREFTFTGNIASYGGALYSYKGHYNVLRGTSIILRRNSASKGGGALYAHIGNITADLSPMVNSTKYILFHNNSAFYGGALAALNSQISFAQTQFSNNSAYHGGAVYLRYCNFESLQSGLYSNNTAEHGGAMYVRLTNITFYDAVYFFYNTARNGGGISVTALSLLHLNPNTSMYFHQNHAREYGGAIYIQGDSLSCAIPNMKIRRFLFAEHFVTNCFVQINNHYCFKKRTNKSSIYEHRLPNVSYQELLMQYEMLPDPGIQIIFQDNFAEVAGNALFGGNIMDCYFSRLKSCPLPFVGYRLQIPSPVNPQQLLVFADTSEESDSSIVSSYPVQLCLCYGEKKSCSGHSAIKKDIFPGQTFTLSVVAVGQMEGVVPATVHSHFERNSSAQFRELEDTQTARKTCTDLHYTVFSRENNEEISIYPEGLCSEYAERLTLSISLHPCPPGFNLSENTSLASCVCEQRLMSYTNTCDITSRTITNRGDSSFWVGYDCDSGLILHPHCPFDYCHSTPVPFTVNSTDLQCNYNRSGLLCGGCKSGLSLTLGTSHCVQCSNTYLFLILIFALAGIGLVLLLFICKLTVSKGTINGLIFYANIIGMSKEMFIPPQHSNVLRVFIAWLNLDLGIETCLFDGMDRYVQVWLQFVFPIYLWILVGVIIKVSQHSSRVARLFGRNPVSVLATLVLLSYAKLLRTSLIIFSLTFLEYPDNVRVPVWLYDGNIKYLSGKHIPLLLVALFTLLFLFVPYTLLLLLGQWLYSYSNYKLLSWVNSVRVKVFLDAYHGPMSDSHRYWVGLLLVLRCFLSIINAFNILGNPELNLLAISTCILGLNAIVKLYTSNVYKKRSLDILENSFLFNTGVLAIATYYTKTAGGNQLALASVSVGTAMTTLVIILLYHSYYQFIESHEWQDSIKSTLKMILGICKRKRNSNNEEIQLHDPVQVNFDDLREPILEYNL